MNSAKAIVNLGVPALTNVTGLRNVDLVDAVSTTTGVAHVSATTDTGSTNVYDFYSAELNQIGAWDVRNSSTGAVVVVSAVALVPAKKAWALTLTTPPAGVTANLKDTITLHGLTTPVDGIESSGAVVVTVP